MSKPNDGGPAFPVTFQHSLRPGYPNEGTKSQDWEGMALRDWFAGMAMQGTVGSWVADVSGEAVKEIARHAYDVADAMLRERRKGERS